MKSEKFKKNIKILLYCLICSIAFLFVASKSSPLYICNDWVDSNIFFNMAKGIANGLVPYKDLFEQKGPLLYFAYVIPYLISNDTFIGVYFLEVIAFTITLYFSYKLVNLFFNEKASLLSLPIFSFLSLNAQSFIDGGSAEELCMPAIMISLYMLINYLKNIYPKPMSKKYVFINGILAGIVLWTKFTFLGFYLGYCIIIGIILLKNKKIKEIFISAGTFLLGMLVPTLICIIYFAINGALYDLFYTYFYVNMTAYGSTSNILMQFIEPLKKFAKSSIKNIIQLIAIAIGFLYMFYRWVIKEKKIFEYIMLCILMYFSILLVYWGIDWQYYYFFFMSFIILGVLALGKLLEIISKNKILFWIELVISVVGLVALSLYINDARYMLKFKKEDVCYYKFSEIMHQYEDPTLLVYNSIDANLFTIANIVPTEKYFFAANMNKDIFTELAEQQKECIENKRVDFVLVKYLWQMGDFSEIPGLNENYDFCGDAYYSIDGTEYFYFYMFRAKGIEDRLKEEYRTE